MASSDPTRVNPDVVKRTLDDIDRQRGASLHARRQPGGYALRDAGETGDGSFTITGHAATTGSEYVLYENDYVRVRERISPNAFDEVLASGPDVHLNWNHDMTLPMARTLAGNLELSMDDVGLRVFARVDPQVSYVNDLSRLMRSGVVDQMSFAFTIADETRTEMDSGDRVEVLYDITKVGNLYDVCVCAQGANPQTDANLRTIAAAHGRASFDLAGLDHRSNVEGDRELLIATHVSGGEVSMRVPLAKAKAEARSKLKHFPAKDPTHAQEA